MFNASMFRAFASGTGHIEWKFVIHIGGKHLYHWYLLNYANQMEHFKMKRPPCLYYFVLSGEADCHSNSNSNSTFIALNLRQKTDSKAHHTKTLFNIQKPEALQGSAPWRKQKGDWKFRVGMLFQRGMTSTLT